jgi:hypothetical protein
VGTSEDEWDEMEYCRRRRSNGAGSVSGLRCICSIPSGIALAERGRAGGISGLPTYGRRLRSIRAVISSIVAVPVSGGVSMMGGRVCVADAGRGGRAG